MTVIRTAKEVSIIIYIYRPTRRKYKRF